MSSPWENPPPPGTEEESHHQHIQQHCSLNPNLKYVTIEKKPKHRRRSRSRDRSCERYKRSRSRSKHRRRSRSRSRHRYRSRSRSRHRHHSRRHKKSHKRSRSHSHSRRSSKHRYYSHSFTKNSDWRIESGGRDRDEDEEKSMSSSAPPPQSSFREENESEFDDESEDEPIKDNAFKNDGSFLEMFKKMQEEKAKETTLNEPNNCTEAKKINLPSFGKRRGGRVLKTGMVLKAKTEDNEENAHDPWSVYMKEVRRYKEACCDDDSKTRPLVK